MYDFKYYCYLCLYFVVLYTWFYEVTKITSKLIMCLKGLKTPKI